MHKREELCGKKAPLFLIQTFNFMIYAFDFPIDLYI